VSSSLEYPLWVALWLLLLYCAGGSWWVGWLLYYRGVRRWRRLWRDHVLRG
jgi:hypothetical protein